MSESKESNTLKPKGGWKLWLAELAVGVLVLSVWAPIAGFIGIIQPWVTTIFIVGWIVFWASPYGPPARAFLERVIRREG